MCVCIYIYIWSQTIYPEKNRPGEEHASCGFIVPEGWGKGHKGVREKGHPVYNTGGHTYCYIPFTAD